LTTGISSLYEGVTICKLILKPDSPLQLLATSTDGFPCMAYATSRDFGNPKAGRMVVDCGTTKLWIDWNSAGTARYVRNICVWLLGIDERIGNGFPVQGAL